MFCGDFRLAAGSASGFLTRSAGPVSPGARMAAVDPIEVFLASLKRCLAQPEFLLNFYALFMDSSEEIRQKFAHTDFRRQTRVLAESFWVISVAAQGPKASPA